MNANASTYGFIVLVTDGESAAGDPVATAEEIRADNVTIIFTVGVGERKRERVHTYIHTFSRFCVLLDINFFRPCGVLGEGATLLAKPSRSAAKLR